MPSNLLINTQTTIGYNNKLKKATAEMKLGVNNTINSDTKSVGIKLMDGGKSKTKTLIITKVDNGDAKGNKSSLEQESANDDETAEATPVETISVTTNHEVTKVGIFIAVAVSALVLWRRIG